MQQNILQHFYGASCSIPVGLKVYWLLVMTETCISFSNGRKFQQTASFVPGYKTCLPLRFKIRLFGENKSSFFRFKTTISLLPFVY